MLKLTLFELQKVWRKKAFLGFLSALLILNVFLLWYGNQGTDTKAPLSAYGSYHNDLQQYSNDERLDFIKGYYDEVKGLELIENIKLYDSWQTEIGSNMAKSLREGNAETFAKYLSQWESGNHTRYTGSLRQEVLFAEEIYAEAAKLENYEGFLSEIEENSNTLSGISIFAAEVSDGFAGRNIEKTASDYKDMHGTPITYDISRGVVGATSSYFSDLIIFLFLFIFAAMLIWEEKQKQLFSLIKITPRGKIESIMAKVLSLLVNTAIVTLLVFGTNLIFFQSMTGLGDLGRSMQSVGEFMGSTLNLSVGGYLLLFLLTKWLVCFMIGLLVLLASILAKHSSVSYLVCSAVLLISYALFAFIPVNSKMTFLKYINLFGLFRVQNIFGMYLNLNVFGNAFSLLQVSLVTITALITILCAGSVIGFISIRNMQNGISPIKKLTGRMAFMRYRPGISLFRHETFKSLVMNKALIVLIVFAALISYQAFSTSVYLSPDENYYKAYMTHLQGEVTPEKIEYLSNEYKRFEGIHEQLAEIDELFKTGEITKMQEEAMSAPLESALNAERTFMKVWEQYEYLQSHPKAEFVYDTGYRALFDIDAIRGKSELLSLCIIIILCGYSVFSMEHASGAWKLISTMPRGKNDTVNKKIIIGMLMAAAAFLASAIPPVVTIGRTYGYSSLSASVTSIQEYAAIPSFVSIAGFAIMLSAFKVLACMAIAMMVLGLSQRGAQGIYSLLLSAVVVAVPILLAVMGLDWCGYFSLLSLFGAGHYLAQPESFLVFIYLILAALAGTASYIYLKRDFGKAR